MTPLTGPLADGPSLHPLPRPVLDWRAQLLEYLYLLGATLWLGVQSTGVLLAAPLLSRGQAAPLEAARILISLLEALGYAAAIASGVLLLTTLGMHVLRLRRPVVVLMQLGLILLMTASAVAPQLWIVPRLWDLLQSPGEASADLLLRATAGLGSMGLLHLMLGAMLVALGTRRCLRYPLPRESSEEIC